VCRAGPGRGWRGGVRAARIGPGSARIGAGAAVKRAVVVCALVLGLGASRARADLVNTIIMGPWVTIEWVNEAVFTVSCRMTEPSTSWHHDRIELWWRNKATGAVGFWDGGSGWMDAWRVAEASGKLDADGSCVVSWPVQTVYPWYPIAFCNGSYLADGEYEVKVLWAGDWNLGYPYVELLDTTFYVFGGVWNQNGTAALPGKGTVEFLGYPSGVWRIAGYRQADDVWPTRIPVEWVTDSTGHKTIVNVYAGTYDLGLQAGSGGSTFGRRLVVEVGQTAQLGIALDSEGNDTGDGGGVVIDPPSGGGSTGGGVTGDWVSSLFVPSEAVIKSLQAHVSALAAWGPFGFLAELGGIFAGGPTAAPLPTIGANTTLPGGIAAPVSIDIGAVSGSFGPIRLVLAAGCWVAFAAFLVHRFFPRQVL
jgi:hypothetical protein